MGDVINFHNPESRLNIDPDKILKSALDKLTDVVICGVDKEGNEYFASSVADGGDILWYLERCKYKLMKNTEIEEEES